MRILIGTNNYIFLAVCFKVLIMLFLYMIQLKTLYLAGIISAQLWWHMPNMELIQKVLMYDFNDHIFNSTEKWMNVTVVTLTPGHRYCKISIISHALSNKLACHADVVGALHVAATPTTPTSFFT